MSYCVACSSPIYGSQQPPFFCIRATKNNSQHFIIQAFRDTVKLNYLSEELSVVDSKTIEDLLTSEKLKYGEETIQENKQIALEKLNSLTDKDLPKKCRKCKRSRELLNALNKKIKKFFNM